MNAQQIIAAIGGAVSLLTMAGGAMLWAGDERYILKQEMAQAIKQNQIEAMKAELEWLETLAQARPLTVEQKFKRDWLRRRIEER